MNPFDLKSALLARHAQHVVLIHFPIALFLMGAFFDVAAQWTRKAALATAAHYNLKVAAFCSVPAVITGVLAWRLQLEGQRLKGTLLLHLIFGLGSAVLIFRRIRTSSGSYRRKVRSRMYMRINLIRDRRCCGRLLRSGMGSGMV